MRLSLPLFMQNLENILAKRRDVSALTGEEKLAIATEGEMRAADCFCETAENHTKGQEFKKSLDEKARIICIRASTWGISAVERLKKGHRNRLETTAANNGQGILAVIMDRGDPVAEHGSIVQFFRVNFSLPGVPPEEYSWMYDTRSKLRFDPNRTGSMHTRNAEKFKKDFDEIYKYFKDAVKRYRKSGQNNSKWSNFCLYKMDDEDQPGNRMPMVWLLGHTIGVTGLDILGLRGLEDTIENSCDETTGGEAGLEEEMAERISSLGQRSRKRTAATLRDDGDLQAIKENMMTSEDLGDALQSAFQAEKNILSKDEEIRTLRTLAIEAEGQVDPGTKAFALLLTLLPPWY